MSHSSAPGDRARVHVDRRIRLALDRTSGKGRRRFLEILNAVRSRSGLLRPAGRREDFDDERLDAVLGGLLALSRNRQHWVRPPEAWLPQGGGPVAQFSSLAHHLLAEYPTPPVLLGAWFAGEGGDAVLQRSWFIRAGRGVSLRDLDLPIPLTRRMVHAFAHAPARFSIPFALRWAQVRGMGGPDRLARAVAITHLGREFGNEEFWAEALRFLIDHPLPDWRSIRLAVEFLQDRRHAWRLVRIADDVEIFLDPPEPDLSLRGWTAGTLLRRAQEWDARRKQDARRAVLRWDRSPIGEFEHVDASGRSWTIHELLDSGDLVAEGRAMEHCVASYAGCCFRRATTIWSLRVEEAGSRKRAVTVEVDPAAREIVQAKAKCNAAPDDHAREVLVRWARHEGLTLQA